MLIVIIFVYLSTEIPFMVITILHVLSTRYHDEYKCVKTLSIVFHPSFLMPLLDYNVASNICLVINAFICLFFPLNFAVYCGMSQDFRNTFNKMFVDKIKETLKLPDQLTNDNRSGREVPKKEHKEKGKLRSSRYLETHL